MRTWVYDPHSGGKKIPPQERKEICKQAEAYSRKRPWYSKIQIHLRFRGQFCYIGKVNKGEDYVYPLCRLRYFNMEKWTLAFFTDSNNTYETSFFENYKDEGTLQDAFKTCDHFIDT